jgi:hypothetical protein
MTRPQFHRKPKSSERSVNDALLSAEQCKLDLPQIIQVVDYQWDTVILADEIKRLRKLIKGLI